MAKQKHPRPTDQATDGPMDKWPTVEAKGEDRGYEAVRPQALAELDATLAGPENPLQPVRGDGIKDPDGEFEVPARMPDRYMHSQESPGPNQAGDSSGRGDIDPQGQQGGTHGGQKAGPALPNEIHPVAAREERRRHSGENAQGGAFREEEASHHQFARGTDGDT